MELVCESISFDGSAVDETGPYPIIKGVHLCGLISEHGYDYLPSAWTNEALAKYDGADSYEGHKDGSRVPTEKVGWFKNPRRRADGTPEADYHLEPDHPMTPRLIRAAKHHQTGYALSHRADVGKVVRGGKTVVESIGKVYSVDIVSRGGTTSGIFESSPEGKAVKQTVKEYLNKAAPKLTDLKLTNRALSLVKEDDFAGAPMMSDAPPAEGDVAGEDKIKAAFKSVIMDVLDKAKCFGGSEDDAAVLKKVKGLMATHSDLSATADAKPDETPAEKEKAAEAARVAEAARIAATKPTLELVLEECEREKFTPTSNQRKALQGITVKEERVAFIKELKGLSAATTPAGGGGHRNTVAESGTGGNSPPPPPAPSPRERMQELAREAQGIPAKK